MQAWRPASSPACEGRSGTNTEPITKIRADLESALKMRHPDPETVRNGPGTVPVPGPSQQQARGSERAGGMIPGARFDGGINSEQAGSHGGPAPSPPRVAGPSSGSAEHCQAIFCGLFDPQQWPTVENIL